MTLLEEFAALAELLGLGTYDTDSADGTIYLSALPPDPDRCMAIARYAGAESSVSSPYDTVSLQYRTRGTATDARDAEADAQAVYDTLHGLHDRTLPGGTWLVLMICPQGGQIYIGTDSNGRHEYTTNFRAEVRRPTEHRPG